MAGRPLDRARRESSRSLTELLSLLGLPSGEPLLPTHSDLVIEAFKAHAITAAELRILRHHASLSVEEQERVLGPRRTVTREDVDRLRVQVAALIEQRKQHDEL